MYPEYIQDSSVLGMYEENKHDFDYYKRRHEFKLKRIALSDRINA